MKRSILILITAAVCGGFGWYFGYTRGTAKADKGVWREFHQTKHQDEFAAAVALAALANLQRGQSQKAEHELATTLSIYYRAHRVDGDTNLIASIQAYAATNAALSNAIYRPIQ